MTSRSVAQGVSGGAARFGARFGARAERLVDQLGLARAGLVVGVDQGRGEVSISPVGVQRVNAAPALAESRSRRRSDAVRALM
jgi:hypothetical protein